MVPKFYKSKTVLIGKADSAVADRSPELETIKLSIGVYFRVYKDDLG